MTKVTIRNYQELAGRTLAQLGNQASDGAHMALGLTTEMGEMQQGEYLEDEVNIREEHGDFNWYVANECNIYGFQFEDLYRTAIDKLGTDEVVWTLHDLVDLHKKEFAYKKPMNTEALKHQLIGCIQYLYTISDAYMFDYLGSLQINIDKLTARYPDKFTEEAALNRDLEKEHNILKK